MHTFKDLKQREWIVNFNFGALLRLKEKTGVDLITVNTDAFSELLSDTIKLVEVAWAIVEQQATTLPLTQEEFENSLDGDSIEAAGMAIVAELIDFSPADRREALKEVWKRVLDSDKATLAMLMRKIEGGEIDAMLNQQVEQFGRDIDDSISKLTMKHQ